MKYKKNSDVISRGNWKLRWRPRLLILLSATVLGYAFYESVIDITIGGIILTACLILILISTLRSVARWKRNWVVKAENPKEVLEIARSSFLKSSILERLTLWAIGERKEFHRIFDSRMVEFKEALKAKGKEHFASRPELTIHKSFGSNVVWAFTMLLLLMVGLVWFRYREDITEKLIALSLFIVSLALFIFFVAKVIKRNKNLIQINRHGIDIEGEHYAWNQLEYIDVEAGKNLVYKKRGKDKESFDLVDLSQSSQSIHEAILFYQQILDDTVEG